MPGGIHSLRSARSSCSDSRRAHSTYHWSLARAAVLCRRPAPGYSEAPQRLYWHRVWRPGAAAQNPAGPAQAGPPGPQLPSLALTAVFFLQSL